MSRRRADADRANGLPTDYWKACELARDGHYKEARAAYVRLERSAAKGNARLCVLIQNDLAVLAAMEGGGNMHTAGQVEFLGRDGYEVRHFYARYPAWGIGRVEGDGCLRGGNRETFGREDGGVRDPRRTATLAANVAIEFAQNEWNVQTIGQRFRAAVDSFGPDYVVISDSWNMKPHLAAAMRGYATILLMQAQECLCPLNNLRLLGVGPARAEQCPRNQLATPQFCHKCLGERGQHSGALHQVERALAGVGTAEYDALLRQSFQEAEAVLVLNPITAALLEPFAKRVGIVPWGVDAARFPWSAGEEEAEQLAIHVSNSGTADEDDSEPQPGRHHDARDENPGMAMELNERDSEPQPGRHPKKGQKNALLPTEAKSTKEKKVKVEWNCCDGTPTRKSKVTFDGDKPVAPR
jgi:hypothetical protein